MYKYTKARAYTNKIKACQRNIKRHYKILYLSALQKKWTKKDDLGTVTIDGGIIIHCCQPPNQFIFN